MTPAPLLQPAIKYIRQCECPLLVLGLHYVLLMSRVLAAWFPAAKFHLLVPHNNSTDWFHSPAYMLGVCDAVLGKLFIFLVMVLVSPEGLNCILTAFCI